MVDLAPPDLAPAPLVPRMHHLAHPDVASLKEMEGEIHSALIIQVVFSIGVTLGPRTGRFPSGSLKNIATATGLPISAIKRISETAAFRTEYEETMNAMRDNPRIKMMQQELTALAVRGLREIAAALSDENISQLARAELSIKLLDRTGLGPGATTPASTTLIQAETVNILAQTGGITASEQAVIEGIRDRYLKGEIAPPIEVEATVEASS